MKLEFDGSSESYAKAMEACAKYVAEAKPKVIEPKAAADLMRPLMLAKPGQETFAAILLDTRSQALATTVVGVGVLDAVSVGPREIFRSAVTEAAASILICHSHPSGDPSPSREDVEITKRFIEAGKVLGIKVVDHIVIGVASDTGLGYVSMRERNLCTFD